jgi:hypothetical protein
MLDTFHARQLAGGVGAPSVTSFGQLFYWPPQLAGLERAEMNGWPLRTSGSGTNAKWRLALKMSAFRGRPEVIGALSE